MERLPKFILKSPKNAHLSHKQGKMYHTKPA